MQHAHNLVKEDCQEQPRGSHDAHKAMSMKITDHLGCDAVWSGT